MDAGGGDDAGLAGGLEEAFGDDQGILQYLEQVIGEDFDEDFMNEFRNSELFADVLRECGVPPGSSNQSNSSRRPSLNESDVGARANNPNTLGPSREESRPPVVSSSTVNLEPSTQNTEREEPSQSTSRNTSRSKRSKNRNTEAPKYETPEPSSSSEDSFEETRTQLQKKLKDKLKIRPVAASTPTVSSSSSRKGKKSESPPKKLETKYVPGPKSRKRQTSQPLTQLFSSTKSNARSPLREKRKQKTQSEASSVPSSSVQHAENKNNERKRDLACTPHSPIEPNIRLVDLSMISRIFPNRIPNTIHITQKLLEEIRLFEMKYKLVPCCNLRSKPVFVIASSEREKIHKTNSGSSVSRSGDVRPENCREKQDKDKQQLKPNRVPYKGENKTDTVHKASNNDDQAGSTGIPSSNLSTGKEVRCQKVIEIENENQPETLGKSKGKNPPLEKSTVKTSPSEKLAVCSTLVEKSPVKTSLPKKSPDKSRVREKSVKTSPLEKSTVKSSLSGKSPVKVSLPEKSLSPSHEKSPDKNLVREKSPVKTSPFGKSPVKISLPEKSPSPVHEMSPEKSSVREKSPVKTSSFEKSPVNSALQEKPLGKICPSEKSPVKTLTHEKSTVKISLLVSSPVKISASDKSSAESASQEKMSSKVSPPEKSSGREVSQNLKPEEVPDKISSTVAESVKKKPMSFDKLAILNETLTKAKTKKDQKSPEKLNSTTSALQVEGKGMAQAKDFEKAQPRSDKHLDITNLKVSPVDKDKMLSPARETTSPSLELSPSSAKVQKSTLVMESKSVSKEADGKELTLITGETIEESQPELPEQSSAGNIHPQTSSSSGALKVISEETEKLTTPCEKGQKVETCLTGILPNITEKEQTTQGNEDAGADVGMKVSIVPSCNDSQAIVDKEKERKVETCLTGVMPNMSEKEQTTQQNEDAGADVGIKVSIVPSCNDSQAIVDKEIVDPKEKPVLMEEQEKDVREVTRPLEDCTDTQEQILIDAGKDGVPRNSEIHVNEHQVDVETSGPPSPDVVVDFGSPPPSIGADDSIDSSSPEIVRARKSPTPDRSMTKKKNVIESSSDDGDHRRDDTDLTDDTTPERKKSSDDELMSSKKGVRFALHNPSIERKREQEDSRSGKFGEFEMERQRKKDKRKGSRDKSGKLDPFEDFLKEKQLSGSFRIPRKTTPTSKAPEPRTVVTPLTAVDVPKENMQFERFRKGLSDKDKIEKKERGEWNNRNRGGDYNEFRGGGNQRLGNDRMQREPGAFDRNKLRDDTRLVLLAPEDGKGGDGTPDNSTQVDPDTGKDLPEPLWADDGEEPGGGDSPANEVGDPDDKKGDDESKNHKDNHDESGTVEAAKLPVVKSEVVVDEQQDMDNDSAIDSAGRLNPEIPLTTVEVNAFAIGALMLLGENPNPELPDVVEEENLAEATMIKIAWWISKADFDNSEDVGSSEDWYKKYQDLSDDDGAQSDCSFNELLKFTQSEEDEVYLSLSKEMQKRKSNGASDEKCGRQLLVSQYRSGPDDQFSNIFHIRGLGAYEKDSFQARCNLCNFLVVGPIQLADHVLGDLHREKMSKAGLDNIKSVDASSAGKEKEKKDDKKLEASSKNGAVKKGGVTESTSEKKDIKDKKKEYDKQKDKEHNNKKRKRSKDGSSPEKSRNESGAELGTTSTGLPIKIPAGAIPDKTKKRSESREKQSRSRSPRHKRNRSRSPRHHSGRGRSPRRKSRSRSPHGSSSRRRRSRSRDQTRDRARDREPVVRISRSPGKLRRRSTSAERVEKFLAKTRRRSRSPSNGYRKRHRPVSPPSNTGLLPKKTNKEFHEKMALTLEGKWTDELENKWKMMEAEEAIFMEQFGEKSKSIRATPESHPTYSDEWKAFWERRYHEIEEEGKEDPDQHDYVPEWKEYWTKKLDELLDKEYEDAIKQIKLRNGLDIDTLQKLRNTFTEPEVALLKQELIPAPLPVPQPVPPPCLPVSAPPPHLFPPRMPSIIGTITPSSKSVSEIGEDMASRPMSISDEGDQSGPKKNIVPTVPSPTVTTIDIMSTWEKLKSGGVPAKQTNSSGPAPPVQQPLRTLSVGKGFDERSVADSSASIESYQFSSGMDVVEVLYKMSRLEDQLSFFADKVQEYFKKAEEMDLQQRNKSYTLLTDDDFVAMLFQIRDRFMAMIRAHILPKDVLDELNITVYGLGGILQHPECQKRQPKVIDPPQIPPPKQDPPLPPPKPVNVSDTFTRPSASSSQSSMSKNPYRNLPDRKKKEIAVLLTSFLMSMGREDLSDAELKVLLGRILQQRTYSPSSVSGSSRNSTPSAPARGASAPTHQNKDSDASGGRSVRFGETGEADPWRLPERNVTTLYSVASFRSEGKSVPDLPNIVPQFRNPGGSSGPIRYGSGSGVEGGDGRWGPRSSFPGKDRDYMSSSSSASGTGGRHSPFSRRDFSGNPGSSNPFRDKGPSVHGSASVVKVETTSKLIDVKGKVERIKREPEVKMPQLTNYQMAGQESRNMKVDPGGRESLVEKEISHHIRMKGGTSVRTRSFEEQVSTQNSGEQEAALDGHNLNLPPGILNMIMKERTQKQRQEAAEIGEVITDVLEDSDYYRRRRKKKKKKKGRLKKKRSGSASSADDSDGSRYARDRSIERQRRRDKRKKRNERGRRSSSESPAERRERKSSQSSIQNRRELSRSRESKRWSGSPSLDRRKTSRTTRSRSTSYERTKERRGLCSRERRRKQSSSETPDRSRRRESGHRHRSSDKSGSDCYIIAEQLNRRPLSRDDVSDEENSRVGRRRSLYCENYEAYENGPEMVFGHKGRRSAPPIDEHIYDDDMWESPYPPQQSTSAHSRLNNPKPARHLSRRRSDCFEMHVPSPSASIKSGNSGYRRIKQRSNLTTVFVPDRSKLMPQVENWESMSEVSSLGEDKKATTNSFSAKFFESITRIAADKAKVQVTSVSKTFWTQNDEDQKSLSSISSHEIKSTASHEAKAVINAMVPASATPETVPVPPPAKLCLRRNYRISKDDENKEPGELSSSSADLEEV